MLHRCFLAVVLILPASGGLSAKSLGWNADALAIELNMIRQIGTPPEGVTDLKFSDLYVHPVGDRGLEYTAKVQALSGTKVRILGFMVRQSRPAMGMALLTAYALTTHEGEYGLCDDLPSATIFVEVPKFRGIAVPFTSGPLLLTGTLELSRREESDGRVSYARLRLDPEMKSAALAAPSVK